MSCREKSNQKIIVFEEKRSKLTLLNSDTVESTRIHVDGCEIHDNSLRCDYMFLAKEKEFYIELKGQDVLHALNQIKATIKRLSPNPNLPNKRAFIICSRVPIESTKLQSLRLKTLRVNSLELVVKSSPYTEAF